MTGIHHSCGPVGFPYGLKQWIRGAPPPQSLHTLGDELLSMTGVSLYNGKRRQITINASNDLRFFSYGLECFNTAAAEFLLSPTTV